MARLDGTEGFRPDISRPGKVGQDGEYSGNKGRNGAVRGTSPQRLPDGASKGLTPSESARVLRQTGIHGSTIDGRTAAEALAGLEPGTLEYAQEVERVEARRKLEQETNGYWREVDGDDNITDAG